jgi:hypothetical protein
MPEFRDGEVHFQQPRLWLALLLLLIPPAVIFAIRTEAFAVVAGIFWMLVSLPVAILTAVDWFRSPVARRGIGKVVHATLRVPILLLGFTAVTFGFVVLAWIVYNLFWERQPEVTSGPLGLAGGVVMYLMMIGVGLKLIRTALRRPPRP